MCQKCAELARKYFPDKTNEEYYALLWGATAFPMCDIEYLEKQLKEMAEKSQGNINVCLSIAEEETSQAHEEMMKTRTNECIKHLKIGEVWERFDIGDGFWKHERRLVKDITDTHVLFENLPLEGEEGTRTADLPETEIRQVTCREWFYWGDCARKE